MCEAEMGSLSFFKRSIDRREDSRRRPAGESEKSSVDAAVVAQMFLPLE